MFKSKTIAAIAVSAVVATSFVSFAASPTSHSGPSASKTTAEVAWRQNSAPEACEGEVFPYQSTGCIAAIMEQNGRSDRQVRVIALDGADNATSAFAAVATLEPAPANIR